MMPMKIHLSLGAVMTCAVLWSCSGLRGSLGDGEFNPLLAPGGLSTSGHANYAFRSGEYVTAASDSTAFFAAKPEGNADADELLAAGTSMRVIKTDGSFVKVELDSGRVGYVAGAMLVESGVASQATTPAGSTTVAPDANLPTAGEVLPEIVSPEGALPPSPEELPLPEPAGTGAAGRE